MRIPCPYCGPRGHDEFAYLGDATLVRPDPGSAHAEAAFIEYSYLRNNPAGTHRELWYHAQGCQTWLIVERDTRTHAVARVVAAREAGTSRAEDA